MIAHRSALATLLALSLLPVAAQADDGDTPDDQGGAQTDPPPPPGARWARRGPGSSGWYRTSPLLPETGDVALGFDAIPFLGYVGNAFNGSTGNTPYVSYPLSDQAIMGKYFLAPDTAVRGRLRVSAYNDVDRFAVVDDNQDADNFDPSDTVIDERYHRYFEVRLAGGLEKRRGHGRLQGIYGAEGTLGVAKSTTLYGYGNNITDDNPAPTTSSFSGGFYNTSTRLLDDKPGAAISLGARGFVGAEFFLAPRVSIGGEFGYDAVVTVNRKGEQLVETYDFADEERVQRTYESPTSFQVGLSTDQLSGDLYLLLHF